MIFGDRQFSLDFCARCAIFTTNILQCKNTGAQQWTQVTPESIKAYYEDAAKAYGDAWKVQATYYEDLVRRNTKAFSDIADARMASYREISEAKTFNQAFEANVAVEESVRDGLVALQEENTKAWEKLVEDLTAIYTPAKEEKKVPAKKAAPAKQAAPKAKAA